MSFDEQSTDFRDYLREKRKLYMDAGRAFLDNNLAFLDNVQDLIKARKAGETDADKYQKVNDTMEGYAKKMENHMHGLLMRQGLKAFFDKDKDSQDVVKKAT